MNLGLRYEYVTPFWERDNNASNFDPKTRSMVIASDKDRYLVDPDRNNFGPRLGFAFTPVRRPRSAVASASATPTSIAPGRRTS